MKLSREEFEKKVKESVDRLVEADMAISHLMHRTPSKEKMLGALGTYYETAECDCARPECPGWVLRPK